MITDKRLNDNFGSKKNFYERNNKSFLAQFDGQKSLIKYREKE